MGGIWHSFTGWSLLDILLLSIVIYQILKLVKRTRSAQIITGVGMVVVVVLASSAFPLIAIHWLFQKFYSSILLILVILFQEEIRLALSKIGNRPVSRAGKSSSAADVGIHEVSRVAFDLAKKRIGALLVMERNIILNRYLDVGISIDSKISKELLMAIFHPTSPVHDGAVVIQKGRIAVAGCFLPLTKTKNLQQEYGTRHRAAIGLSEETDAVVVVVSEEKGTVLLVMDGAVVQQTDAEMLQVALRAALSSHQPETNELLLGEGR